ncbi:MAG: succinate dehydrogenase/fumarate reductase iron-sulfur subunit [Burkholderiales bacterium]|nr:succinate dehydrogenase/fumarate reductase iron-sulfur subunit [Burkholderiales bacterium]
MSTQSMSFNLRVWRQDGPQAPGRLVDYKVVDISPEMSFLEMLDELNVQLTRRGERPVEFDSDCREGICGMCGLVITGVPHGPLSATTTCTLRMRHFQNGQTIVIEPFRAAAFPIVRDLVVDRSALDRIIQAGGFVSQNVGSAPDGNAIPVPKDDAENAMDAAVCIGCGACVASCPNASAFLFTSAKVSQLASLPQGRPEARRRVAGMVRQMDLEGFGNCTNHGECEAVCPQEVSIQHIARMRKEYWKALLGWSTRSRASAE